MIDIAFGVLLGNIATILVALAVLSMIEHSIK